MNRGRVYSVAMLLIIYCFAISYVSLSFGTLYARASVEQKHTAYFSDVSSNFSYHTTQSITAVYSFNNIPVPVFKIQWVDFYTSASVYELIFESKLFQYIKCSKSIPIDRSNTDIIFPFHYFW